VTSPEAPPSAETRARRLCFLRCLEEVDADGFLVDRDAWRRALRVGIPESDALGKLDTLAGRVETEIERRHDVRLGGHYRQHWPAIRGTALTVAGIVGISANYLGPAGRVNLLLNAFIILLFWHLAIYGFMAWRHVLVRRTGLGSVAGAGGWLTRAAVRLAALPVTSRSGDPPARRLLVAARVQLTRRWSETNGTLEMSRATALIHTVSAVLTTGIVIGFYLRGLVADYDFVWSSTFIDNPETARGVLDVLFLPAVTAGRLLFGWQGLPPLSGDNGAAWIHLYAVTLFLYVLVPRAALATTAALRARRAMRGNLFPTDSAWALRILAPLEGRDRAPQVLAYSYTLEDEARASLKRLARALWGSRSAEAVFQRLDWGATEPAAGTGADEDAVYMVVFNGVQTPEDEVHGAFMRNLRARVAGVPLVTVVDGAEVDAAMATERRTAWEAVIDELAWIDLSRAPSPEDVEAAIATARQIP